MTTFEKMNKNKFQKLKFYYFKGIRKTKIEIKYHNYLLLLNAIKINIS